MWKRLSLILPNVFMITLMMYNMYIFSVGITDLYLLKITFNTSVCVKCNSQPIARIFISIITASYIVNMVCPMLTFGAISVNYYCNNRKELPFVAKSVYYMLIIVTTMSVISYYSISDIYCPELSGSFITLQHFILMILGSIYFVIVLFAKIYFIIYKYKKLKNIQPLSTVYYY
jgi:hypothetical protein